MNQLDRLKTPSLPRFLTSLLVIALFLVGCASGTSQPGLAVQMTPIAVEEATEPAAPLTVTEAITETIEPSPAATQPVEEAADTEQAELEELLSTELELTRIAEEAQYGALEGVYAFPLEQTDADGSKLWVAHTIGMRSFEPLQNHVVAIYERADAGWQELARFEFVDSDEPPASSETEQSAAGNPDSYSLGPDYLAAGTVQQVLIEPTHIWLEVQGASGAHSGTYHLLAYADQTITLEAKHFSVSPGSGRVVDLNGDGIMEVQLDVSDPYVFCYACGVTVIQYELLRWDGTQLAPVTLSPLPESAPADLRAANERAIALAQAGLWKDALETLDTLDLSGDVAPELAWNVTYILLNADAKAAVIEENRSAFPLLAQLFYGDYAEVLNTLRAYTPEEVFSPDSPLVMGTPAEGDKSILSERLITNADSARAVASELGEAFFVRAWGHFLVEGFTEGVKADMARAAELLPQDEFVQAANTYVLYAE